ncbi:MAG TPA: hypothetical protein VMQ48_00745 [Candidatus Saccharimonadales bacterium]|jgi:hypothetical protein|nr:hypothetical protein [Candidatus Saccharimonadales bacterium]
MRPSACGKIFPRIPYMVSAARHRNQPGLKDGQGGTKAGCSGRKSLGVGVLEGFSVGRERNHTNGKSCTLARRLAPTRLRKKVQSPIFKSGAGKGDGGKVKCPNTERVLPRLTHASRSPSG